MNSATRIGCTLGAVAMTALSLAACSSSSPTTAASPSLVGGMTECTDAAVGAAATQAAQAASAVATMKPATVPAMPVAKKEKKGGC